MLNFRSLNILFICLLLLCIAGSVVYALPFYVYVLLALAYGALLFYGCYYVGSNFFIKVICEAKTDKKVVALSFDDGPVAGNTSQILQILKDTQAEAAFFCIGNRIAGNEVLLKQIHTDGHLIGNHTFTHHYWFDMFGAEKMLSDMHLMDKAMDDVLGKTPKLFRPPYGVTNPNLAKAIVDGNYIPVGWSIRSMDTVIKDEQKLFNKITNHIKPGAVVLLHDTSNATVAILPALIKHIRANGYEIMRLDKMLNLPAYA